MGGRGSGGRRPGAGRPRKSAEERALTGNAGHRGRVLPHPSAATAPTTPPAEPAGVRFPILVIDEEHAPNELTVEERLMWLRLGKVAAKNGTLTEDKALDFLRLCKHVVLEQRYANSVTDQGSANHRGLIQRVDIGLTRFGLAGSGKPTLSDASQPAAGDPMKEKYFGGSGHRA